MSHFSPKSVTLVEANPETITGYVITVRRDSDNTLLFTTTAYPSNPSGTTVIPLGSDGTFGGLTGEVIQLYSTEQAATGHGPNPLAQQFPGGPFTIITLADGSESMSVLV